ncbi:hypothetical protein, partial [Plasmodium yoelii yoelii]
MVILNYHHKIYFSILN